MIDFIFEFLGDFIFVGILDWISKLEFETVSKRKSKKKKTAPD